MVEMFEWLNLKGKREIEKPRGRPIPAEELARRVRPKTPLEALKEANRRSNDLKAKIQPEDD